jgi:uncharacterized protein (DUF58 family)
VGIVGLATGATALVTLCAAGLALLILAWAASRRALAGLGVQRDVYPSAFEDDPVRVELRLDNRGRRATALVEVVDAFAAGIADRQALLEPGPLGPLRRRRLAYRSAASKPWGEYRIGPILLGACDALGLFAARRAVPEVETFTVFPLVHHVAALDRLGGRASLAPQALTAGRSGQSLDYLGAREYRPGDDVRRIHWPATARRGVAVVREHEVDLIPYFTLFVDLQREGRAGTGRKSTLEYVVRTAASLVWTAAGRGDVVQLLGEGSQPLLVPPGRGEIHATRCLYELVRVRQEGRLPLLDLVLRSRPLLPRGSTAALLCSGLALDVLRLEEELAGLQAAGVVPVVFVVDDASFVGIDRPPLPATEAAARRERLTCVLAERSVAGRILGAQDDLGRALARTGLFGDAA